MFALKFSRELFFVVILLFGLPLISLAGAGDGSGGSTDAASSLGFAADDGFYGNNTQGTVGTSDAEAAAAGGDSASGLSSLADSIGKTLSKTMTLAKTPIPVNTTVKKSPVTHMSFVYNQDNKVIGFLSPTGSYVALGAPSAAQPTTAPTPTTADTSRFGPTAQDSKTGRLGSTGISPVDFSPLGEPDPSRYGYGEESGPTAADNPGGFGNPGTGNPGGNPGTGNPGGGNPGGDNPGGGNPGGGLGGGNPGGGNPGGGNPGGGGLGDNSASNPDNWYHTVTVLAQGLQTALSVNNSAFTLVNNAIQFGTNTVLNSPTVPRNIPRYTNFNDLTQINSSTTIRLIARADRTDDWQIEETVDPSVASSSVRLLTTQNEMDAWYTGRSEGVNSIVLEAKVIGSDGRVIVNWVAIPFGALNIPKAAQLHLRWNADSYTQCLAFLNDNGRYTFQTKDRSMKRGDTEAEQYDIPEVTGVYSIQCARQTNTGTIVDQKNIQVIVGS